MIGPSGGPTFVLPGLRYIGFTIESLGKAKQLTVGTVF